MSLSTNTRHVSVMLDEVLDYLKVERPDSLLLDCTLGGGGHSEALLKAAENSFLVGMDRDLTALARCKERLENFEDRTCFLHGNFADLSAVSEEARSDFPSEYRERLFDRVLADRGLSSDQLDDTTRGFSFGEEGPLDMRMDQSSKLPADEILNEYSFVELRRVFHRGDVGRNSAALAKAVIASRPIRDTKHFSEICIDVSRRDKRQQKSSHPATVPFQAVRIEANSELSSLSSFLESIVELLAPGGRLAIISFHSLEDKYVARAMRAWSRTTAPAKLPVTGEQKGLGSLLTSKAITPSDSEVEQNPRARSARLRVYEKYGG